MNFTNSESVVVEIDVPRYWAQTVVVMTLFHYWIVIQEQRVHTEAYKQTLKHLYIPRSFPISNSHFVKISEEIER